jgi:hypothetical protein
MATKAFARMNTRKKIYAVGAYIHNNRLKENDKNVFPEFSHKNINIKFQDKTYRQAEIEFHKLHKEKQGVKHQPKAIPLREIVLLTDNNTNIEKLKLFVNEVEKMTRFKAISLNWHKDEGHYNNGEFVENQHCHIVFEAFDKATGKTIRPPLGFTEILQDLASVCLEMERGQSKKETKKIHLTPEQYKQTKKMIDDDIKNYKKVKNLDNLIKTGYEKSINELSIENEKLKKQILDLNKKGFDFESVENLKKDNQFYVNKLDTLQELFDILNIDINVYDNNDVEVIKKKLIDKIEEDYKKQREELKQSGIAKQADYSNLKKQKEAIIDVLSSKTTKPQELEKQEHKTPLKALQINKKDQLDIG